MERRPGGPSGARGCSSQRRAYARDLELADVGVEPADAVMVGDDVEFTEGWIQAARAVSQRGDVIGTNDSEEGRVRNPEVAAGRHAAPRQDPVAPTG